MSTGFRVVQSTSDVYFQSETIEPKNMVGVFNYLTKDFNYNKDVGRTAARLIFMLENLGYKPKVATSVIGYDTNNYYTLAVNASGFNIEAYTIINGSVNGKPFRGNVNQFEEFVNPSHKLKTYIGKLLRFKYDGGTEKQGIRIVRLEDVGNTTDGNVVLKGTDMAHALAKDSKDKGFRTYKIDKIVGEIEILN